MESNQILEQLNKKLEAALERFEVDLKHFRTGRASTSLLDGVLVEAYGQAMPINQVASISTPEATLLQITPFDPSNLQAIANAIRNDQSLGFNPTDDGHVVRVPVPPLTEERRADLAKQIGGRKEEALVSLRSARHDAQSHIAKLKKDKQIGEDETRSLEKKIDSAVELTKQKVEDASSSKEREVMSM